MYSTIAFIFFALSPLGSSHMIMRTPTPFSASKLAGDNGPLKPDGSDFPCKFGYETEGASNVMPLGSRQELAFTGGATHGGGSCQVSITYDKAPTADSKFKVIHSIIGGCPARNAEGNIGTTATMEDPDKYSFKIPENLPTGDVVIAWTWFNKIGNREMYMNCAPAKLTGGSGNDKELSANGTQMVRRDTATFDALPDMFVANIGNGCTTKDSTDLKFEDPGESVEVLSTKALAGPVGSCGQAKGSTSSKNPGSDSASEKPESEASQKKPGSQASPKKSGSGSSSYDAESETSPKKTGSGSSSDDAESETPKESGSQSSSKDPASSTPVAGAFYTIQPSNPKSSTSESSASSLSNNTESSDDSPASPKASGASSSSTGSSSTAADSTAAGSECSPEGIWNCIGGKSYQQCASGTWSVVMPLAGGTKCNAGISASIKVVAIDKRHVRFSNAHLRRHIHSSPRH